MIDLGIVKPGSTIRIPFNTFKGADGSSITMTNFAAADILIYKDGSTTERASTSGYTATTDFDGKTGKQFIVVDLADNTTAGHWGAGSEYHVAVDAVTVDGFTTGGWVARFSIGYPGATLDTTIATLASQTSFTLTAGPAEDDALNDMWVIIHDIDSAVRWSRAMVLDYTGSTKTVTLAAGATFTAAAGDNISIMGPAPMQPATPGRKPVVDASGLIDANAVKGGPTGSGVAISANLITNLKTIYDTDYATIYDTTNKAFLSKLGNFAMGGSSLALTTGAIACTTITASGAVAFQSTFAVTGTTTHTGNVALSNGMTITQATTNGHGISVTGNGTGHGIYTVSGGTNSNGLLALGSGSGSGIGGWGGATGNGFSGTGGATSGDGLHVVASTSGAGIHAAGAGGTADITGNLSGSVGSVTAAVNTTSAVKKNTARAAFPFSMIDTTTKVPVTGKTVTVTRSIDGAAFAAGTLSAVTELSDGVYLADFAAADLNGDCIVLKATATGCDVTLERILTQP